MIEKLKGIPFAIVVSESDILGIPNKDIFAVTTKNVNGFDLSRSTRWLYERTLTPQELAKFKKIRDTHFQLGFSCDGVNVYELPDTNFWGVYQDHKAAKLAAIEKIKQESIKKMGS